MKKLFVLAIAIVALGFMGQASAQVDVQTISVTVTFATQLSITINSNAWDLSPPAVDVGDADKVSAAYTVINESKVKVKLWARASDGPVGGWTLAALPGPDTFSVVADTTVPAVLSVVLDSPGKELAAEVVKLIGTCVFTLTYKVPTDSSLDDGDQSFSVQVKAARTSAALPALPW